MKTLQTICLSIAVLLLTGCTGYGRLTRNLADNGSIVKLKIGTPWGVQDVMRVGETTSTVVVYPDGTILVNPPK